MTNKYIKTQINSRFEDAFRQCESNGLIQSRKSAASALGISPQLLSEILNHRVNVGTEIIHRFCSEFGFNIQHIFFGVDFNEIANTDKEIEEPKTIKNSLLLKVKCSADYWLKIINSNKGIKNSIKNRDLPQYFFLPNTFSVNVDAYAFKIRESHMLPLLSPNMTVVGARVKDNSNIVNGQVYIIHHKNLGVICRRCYWIDKTKRQIELTPDNPEYSSIKCSVDEIESQYRIVSFIGFNLDITYKQTNKLNASASKS